MNRRAALRQDSKANYMSRGHFLFHFHHLMEHLRHCDQHHLELEIVAMLAGTVDSDANYDE